MNARALTILALLLLWLAGCWYWYTCKIKGLCGGNKGTTHQSGISSNSSTESGPLVFNWSSAKPNTGKEFQQYQSTLMKSATDDNLLEITGWYTEQETNTSKLANLGLARAEEVKKLLSSKMDPSRIRITSKQVPTREHMRKDPFAGIEFKFMDKPAERSAVNRPIMFACNSAKPVTNAKFESYKNRVSGELKNDKKLLITGIYRESETNDTKYENLGIARAMEMKKVFTPKVKGSLIETSSRMLEGQSCPDGMFESVDIKMTALDGGQAPVVQQGKAKVQQIKDGVRIYFASNSTQKAVDASIDKYLAELANEMKAGSRKIQIVGHTDDRGEAAPNKALGMKRANQVRNILVKKGAPARLITVESKGEDAPIADNNTDAGRQQNRRVEILFK